MSLTGPLTRILAITLCVLAPIAALLLWGRLAGLRRWRWPLRTVLVVFSQLCAVFLAIVLVNDTYGFYTSWRELAGLENHSVRSRTAAPGSQDAAVRTQVEQAARQGHGTVVTIHIPGTAAGLPSYPALVYLPPQYGSPDYAGRSFPVVELITGAGGHPKTWTQDMQVAAVLDKAIARGAALPMIAVMPTVTVDEPRDTECVNVPHGPQVETYLVRDVRSAVQQQFRAATDANGWALLGYSSGGYCAANLLLRNPDRYHAAVSLSGYAKPYLDSTTGALFDHDRQLQDQNTPLWRMQHLPQPAVQLMLMTTHDDRDSYRDAQAMAQAARAPLQLTVLALAHGGHNFGVWRAQEPTAFGWLSRQVTPPLTPVPTVDGHAPK